MKKKYTDADIKKMLDDVSELMPEIDPNDSEWKEFLKEFIAARPQAKIDAVFAKELRYKLLQKAAGVHVPKRILIPRWMKFTAPLALGVAVCAVVIVPMLKTPESIQTKDVRVFVPVVDQVNSKIPIIEEEIKDETKKIKKIIMKPMMAQKEVPVRKVVPVEYEEEVVIQEEPKETKKVSVPAFVPERTNESETVDNFTTKQVSEVEEKTVVEEPVFTDVSEESMESEAISFSAEPAVAPLRWENVPSDVDILFAATTFVTQQGIIIEQKPFIDKWWQSENIEISEFAPDYFEVVFPQNNGREIRVEVNIRTMEVTK